jgi:outer membrane protein OmpA-like peptidoglycan-associated protein
MNKILPIALAIVAAVVVAVLLRNKEDPAPPTQATAPQNTTAPASDNAAQPAAAPTPSTSPSPSTSDAARAAAKEELPSVLAGALSNESTRGPFFNLPNGISIQAKEGGFLDRASTFVSTSKTGATKTFPLDEIVFEPNSNTLTGDSWPQIQQLAALMAAYPVIMVRLDGRSAGNDPLPEHAKAVRAALLSRGVAPPRIDYLKNADPKVLAELAPKGKDWVAVEITRN